jgi:hypothetical protein
VLYLVSMNSCKKYLDAKPSTSYSTISSIETVQQILDNSINLNLQPSLYYGEWASDNYYLSQATYDASLGTGMADLYIWGKYPFLASNPGYDSWSSVYAGIMIANTALNAIATIDDKVNNQESTNTAKGCALAFRGYFHWKVATTFAKSFDNRTAKVDLGIPLRLDANLNEKSIRASNFDTYNQIISDLKAAVRLVPRNANFITRPSKRSVYAMLSEVYLSMRDFESAENYADSSLILSHELIDFNKLDKGALAPIPVLASNKEILISFASFGSPWFQGSSNLVDSNLYNSYQSSDQRKRLFFTSNGDGTFFFSGSYFPSDQGANFTGLTTAEMYLTRAECRARAGKIAEAMEDLNVLMKNRIDNVSYVPYSANSPSEALKIILEERRKELVFRDLRWMDIKRLNLEGANIMLTRHVSGKTYVLEPNSNRYAIQLPPEVIQLSGMQQNPY